MRVFDGLRHDVRYALRTLRRAPAFTAVVLLSLTVGVGASIATFSLLNALFWQRLPVHDPDRLVLVWPTDASGAHSDLAFYHPEFLQFRDGASFFSGVSATWIVDRSNVIVDENGTNAGPVRVGLISGDYFTTLGVQPARGRFLTPDDDRAIGGARRCDQRCILEGAFSYLQ